MIYGSKARAIWTGQEPTDVACGSCGGKTLRPRVFQRYFHIFWIPFFPIGKKVFFECARCKQTIEPKEGPAALVPLARKAKAAAKTPKYLFLGLAALVVLVGVAKFQSWAETRHSKAWAASPAVGDLYVLDVTKVLPAMEKDTFKYVVARVDKVSSEEVEIVFGSYGYAFPTGAEKAIKKGEARKNGYFTAQHLPLERSQIVAWQADRSLRTVIRE